MIKVVCTDKNGMHRELEAGPFASTLSSWVRDYKFGGMSKVQKLPVIKLDPDKKYQEILGFGGAFTDASCYLINTLDKDAREELMKNLYSQSGMGFNVGRLTVAQCDFGRVVYSYDDTPDDIEMKNFSIDYDREYIIPVVRQAGEISGELFLLSSPWSPPGWMKTGGLMTGGWMRNKYLEAYAEYYLRYIQEYGKAGIKINALTSQNESETDQLSLMPACYWHPETEMAFLRDYLAPLLKKHGLDDIEFWIMDHNYIMWRRAKWMLDDPGLKAVVKGAAFHPYEGPATAMTKLRDAHPEIDVHMTEEGAGFNPTNTAVCGLSTGYVDMMKNWSRSIFLWNIALNEFGKPHVGPFFRFEEENGGGILQIHSKTREVKFGHQYYALGHFSRFIKRGAVRIESECDVNGINQVAFVNPNGEYVVVLVNPGEATEISVEVRERYAQVPVPEASTITLVFK